MNKKEFKTLLTKKGYAFTEENETVIVNNQGYVDLRSLVPDSINAGTKNRSLFVVLQKIRLGFFWWTEQDAIVAISKDYNGKAAKAYIEKVESAFAKAKIRYSTFLTQTK